MPGHGMPYHGMTGHAMARHVMSCHAMSGHAMDDNGRLWTAMDNSRRPAKVEEGLNRSTPYQDNGLK